MNVYMRFYIVLNAIICSSMSTHGITHTTDIAAPVTSAAQVVDLGWPRISCAHSIEL